MLVCPVRGCALPLARREANGHAGSIACARGHSFDIARSGYINLLQPQDRRSKQPGDSAAVVEARQRLHDRGVTDPFLDAIAGLARATPTDIALDAGCGDGFYLGNLARRSGCEAHGIDLSVPAIRAAARRFPPRASEEPTTRFEWIVANADRFLPYADASFTLALSITGRMHSPEIRRVLKHDGRLVVAVAAPEDLIELRGGEQRQPGRDRVPRTLENFAGEFQLSGQSHVTTAADLDAEGVRDVLISIYRPLRARPIEAMRVTFSLDLLLFRPRI